MLRKQFHLGNNVPTHIRENTYFSRQKPRQLLSVQKNFEGCFIVKDHMTQILLYCIKRYKLGERQKLNLKKGVFRF